MSQDVPVPAKYAVALAAIGSEIVQTLISERSSARTPLASAQLHLPLEVFYHIAISRSKHNLLIINSIGCKSGKWTQTCKYTHTKEPAYHRDVLVEHLFVREVSQQKLVVLQHSHHIEHTLGKMGHNNLE